MTIMVVAIVVLLASILFGEILLKLKIPAVLKTFPASSPPEPKKLNLVFHKQWVDVQPAPLKVIQFSETKIVGRLVMHGPYGGVVTRVLMLWRGDKHKSIVLDALYGVGNESIEQVYSKTLEEGKKIAEAVYGKRSKLVKQSAKPEPVVSQPKVEIQQVQAVTNSPVIAVPERPVVSVSDAPIIKGFIAQHVGVIVDAGMQKHVTTRNGVPEEYETFTLTLNTPTGPEQITGNDLRRALSKAGVNKGDHIQATHLKNIDLPNSGFKKKSYQIIKLTHK